MPFYVLASGDSSVIQPFPPQDDKTQADLSGQGFAWSRTDFLAMFWSLRKFGTVMKVNSTPIPSDGSDLRTSTRLCGPSSTSRESSSSLPTGTVCGV